MERITIPGAAMLAVVTALQMCCETGDNIVIVSPIWPNIFQAAKVVGAEPRLVRLDEDWAAGRWHLDLDKLFDACDHRTKALFLASPGNPTGWMLSHEEQKTILDFCRARGIAILADEVYGTLIYDGAAHAPSFLTIADENDAVFGINSFSKPWAMTGMAGGLAGASQKRGRRRRRWPSATTPAPRISRSMARWRRCRRKAMPSAPRLWNAAGPAAMWCRIGSAVRTGCAG